ncbi:unnamed protein product [Discula destructiva]
MLKVIHVNHIAIRRRATATWFGSASSPLKSAFPIPIPIPIPTPARSFTSSLAPASDEQKPPPQDQQHPDTPPGTVDLPRLKWPAEPWDGNPDDRWLSPWESKRKAQHGDGWRKAITSKSAKARAFIHKSRRATQIRAWKKDYGGHAWEAIADFMFAMSFTVRSWEGRAKRLGHLAEARILDFLAGAESERLRAIRESLVKQIEERKGAGGQVDKLEKFIVKGRSALRKGNVMQVRAEEAVLDFIERSIGDRAKRLHHFRRIHADQHRRSNVKKLGHARCVQLDKNLKQLASAIAKSGASNGPAAKTE